MIAPVENQRSDADVALRRFRVQQSDDSRESMPLAALDSMRSVVARHPAIAMATAILLGVGAGWLIKRRGH